MSSRTTTEIARENQPNLLGSITSNMQHSPRSLNASRGPTPWVSYVRHMLPELAALAGEIGFALFLTVGNHSIRQWWHSLAPAPRGGLLLSALAIVVGTIWSLLRAPSTAKFRDELEQLREKVSNQEADNRQLLEDELIRLSSDVLGFGNDERISVYERIPSQGVLVLAGRYSVNPAHMKTTRILYPENEGVIQEALRSGECLVDSFPDPRLNYEDYITKHKSMGLRDETARALTMKSMTYGGLAIKDTTNSHRNAVVILESSRQNAFGMDDVRKVIERGGTSRLAKLISLRAAAKSRTHSGPIARGEI